MAKNVLNKITQTNDKKIIKQIYQAEQYHRAEQTFWQLAHWAGGNLQRWKEVKQALRKSALLCSIYKRHIHHAHVVFTTITQKAGSNSVAWRKVVKKCRKNPLLMRELMLLVQEQQSEQLKKRNMEYPSELIYNDHPIQTSGLLPKIK